MTSKWSVSTFDPELGKIKEYHDKQIKGIKLYKLNTDRWNTIMKYSLWKPHKDKKKLPLLKEKFPTIKIIIPNKNLK